jgi:tRNA 2-(methylsulfanyl)-N6-isopentenyladenosine37 hydroxylase
MLCLTSDTDPAWVHTALRDPAALLADHAQCEKKAALTALSLTKAFRDHPQAVRDLIAFAREELEHYEAVTALLQARNWSLEAHPGDPYVQALREAAAPDCQQKLLDRLLIAALIEARSTERLKLLSEHHPDPEIAQFCGDLMATEAGHYVFFVRLASERFGPQVANSRLRALAIREASVVVGLPHVSRVH